MFVMGPNDKIEAVLNVLFDDPNFMLYVRKAAKDRVTSGKGVLDDNGVNKRMKVIIDECINDAFTTFDIKDLLMPLQYSKSDSQSSLQYSKSDSQSSQSSDRKDLTSASSLKTSISPPKFSVSEPIQVPVKSKLKSKLRKLKKSVLASTSTLESKTQTNEIEIELLPTRAEALQKEVSVNEMETKPQSLKARISPNSPKRYADNIDNSTDDIFSPAPPRHSTWSPRSPSIGLHSEPEFDNLPVLISDKGKVDFSKRYRFNTTFPLPIANKNENKAAKKEKKKPLIPVPVKSRSPVKSISPSINTKIKPQISSSNNLDSTISSSTNTIPWSVRIQPANSNNIDNPYDSVEEWISAIKDRTTAPLHDFIDIDDDNDNNNNLAYRQSPKFDGDDDYEIPEDDIELISNYDDDISVLSEKENSSSSKRIKFHEKIVSDVFYTEPYRREEISDLFFTHHEAIKSQLEHGRELDAADEANIPWTTWIDSKTDEELLAFAEEGEIEEFEDDEVDEIYEYSEGEEK